MAGTQDEDMYLFQGGLDQTPGAFPGQDFDNFLDTSPGDGMEQTLDGGFMNPNDLTIKREQTDSVLGIAGRPPRSARSSGSSSSSATSQGYTMAGDGRTSGASNNQSWGTGINGLTMPSGEQYYNDTSMTDLGDDLDASNQEMATAFDFETAASTPSGFDAASVATMKAGPSQPFRRTGNMAVFAPNKTASPRLPAGGQAQFYMTGSREASPLSQMLSQNQAPSPWSKHSPSSGLEETFNHITMNGDSPGNATFSPNMPFNSNGFTFEPDSSTTPSTYNKDISSPPSTINSGDGSTHLTIYPTSLKSRVETQIPIKMVLYPLPQGVKKLRLPTYTVSKPKFLAKPEVDKSPEIFELHTSLVCTSAMQDPVRLERALARARGDDLSAYSRPSPASSNGSQTSSRDDEEKPLNGGEVKICSGCIQRERKRASRKKQKKPEEEEMFQKDEERRVVVFNTSEIKDWVEVTKDNLPPGDHIPTPPAGAMQVELPMRIACYCRHQNEKMGFQVIFTIKDYRDKIIAQAMTNSIMITDDHKTHNAPAPPQTSQMPQMPTGPQLPGAGVFSTSGMEMSHSSPTNGKLFKQSFSTTDLHNLQHNFNPLFPMTPASNPFAITAPMSATTSGTMTPRNLSRPASPSGPTGPTTKRRKQSGSGKLPSGLTMTRLDTTSAPPTGPATMPNTAASSPYASNMPSFMSSTERYSMHPSRPQNYGTSPPTPNGNESAFAAGINRTFSLENIPRQTMMSAPPSRQPSRPNSPRPTSNRNSFGSTDPGFGQAVNNVLMNQQSRRPTPIIHKLVPAEGSVTGGTEVTLLGNGFYQGLEVMFGDTEATTTTFWGEKCLNCIAPPALQPGVVTVIFKHEHPQYATMQQTSQTRHSIFTYVDDREIELLRLALRTIGKQMTHPTDDPYSAAQQLLQQNQTQSMWPQSGTYGMSSGGHQRQMSNMRAHQMEMLRLESSMLSMLQYAQKDTRFSTELLQLRRPTGLTLLHLASSLGMTRFVAALLSAGVNPNLIDGCGHSPMHHAAMHGHDQIITRLRYAGADRNARSIRHFVPADLATTLVAYQATIQSHHQHHHRSRSAGSRAGQVRARGDSIVISEPYSMYSADGTEESDSSFSESEDSFLDTSTTLTEGDGRIPFAQPKSNLPPSSYPSSRRGSSQLSLNVISDHAPSQITEQQPGSAGALLQAWRQLLNATNVQQQQLADQLQHFHDSAQWAMPQLPMLPQDNPVIRRMSALLPQRLISSDQNNTANSEWRFPNHPESPSSSTAPPAYDELYPTSASSASDESLKKSSAVRAAADAAADLHYEQQEQTSNKNSENGVVSHQTRTQPIHRVELMKDRKLFLFWIPLLVLVLCLILRGSGVLEVINLITSGFTTIPNRAPELLHTV